MWDLLVQWASESSVFLVQRFNYFYLTFGQVGKD